ncbi:hypothetical protein SDRG_16320 [Saprolegnia diclina VS20]|uniref:Uncharacterized protein n=1 Tax=Saprolegnia diclina (strain VS20) TaxID=1156394 RepID=T0PUG7_SAPDV|nr:hypothetical protein SDRG_16320 [Saprolegnia diclina VS20]EQC25871.1 hypothetical protein SDRG_16320 [Saprolegnia diclina VS20]|eukprot:XP_008620746.1 hypothetical protein SDRG_16320 [Saprolegnia diclina VS20]
MELQAAVEKIMSDEAVSGLAWHDAKGLLLAVDGDLAHRGHTGLGGLAATADRAEDLGRDADVSPVIRIETSKRTLLVQRQADRSVLAISTLKTDEA